MRKNPRTEKRKKVSEKPRAVGKKTTRIQKPKPSRDLRMLVISSFAALAVFFLLVWLRFLGLHPGPNVFFYLAPLGVILALAEEAVFRGVIQKTIGTLPQVLFYIAYSGFVAAWFVPESQISFVAASLPIALLATALAIRFGSNAALWFRVFFLGFAAVAIVSASLAQSLLILLAPFALVQVRAGTTEEVVEALSLKWPGAKRALLAGAKLFAIIFAALFAEGVVLNALGIEDAVKVAEVIERQSLLGIALAVTLAPVGEEIFFRGFLQKHVGIVFSAAVFAALHWGYGSVAEIVAAFTVSIILGLWVRENKTVFPAILAHAFYNAFSITAIILFAQA